MRSLCALRCLDNQPDSVVLVVGRSVAVDRDVPAFPLPAHPAVANVHAVDTPSKPRVRDETGCVCVRHRVVRCPNLFLLPHIIEFNG